MANVRTNLYRIRTRIAQNLTDDRYVLELVSPEKLDRRIIEGEVAHRFKSLDEIPESILQTLPQHAGGTTRDLAKSFDQGLRLVVVMVGDAFGSMGWVRLAQDFRWIVPTSPNDRLASRGYTNPEMRGQGLYSRCITASIEENFEGRAEGGAVLSDCHVHNEAAMRQFLKRGAFKIVSRVRPLTPAALDGIYNRVGAPRD